MSTHDHDRRLDEPPDPNTTHHYETEDGETTIVIYECERPLAWIQSDTWYTLDE